MAASEVFENVGSQESGWIISWLKSSVGGDSEETLILEFMVWSIISYWLLQFLIFNHFNFLQGLHEYIILGIFL